MPFGEYENFDDCLSKNSDKDDPSAYCGYIKHQVEEALKQKEAREAINKATEQTPEQVASLTTPDAGNVQTEEPKDLTSPPTSSKEAENDQASGDGELSPADPPQDQAEPEANPQDQAKPNQQNATEDDLPTRDDADYKAPEDEFKDERRDEHQELEYNGESYHKVKAIEYDDEIYIQKDDKEEASEDDLEYEEDVYKKAGEDTLELDDDYYVKDNEQAPMDLSGSTATPALDVPEMNPVLGESVIIKENGRYKKYHVFQASEQEEPSVEQPAEVPDQPPVVEPQPEISEQPQETKVQPVEQQASEDIKAVEKIIVKEGNKLKFKSVFREVKKKASRMTR